MLGLEEIPLLFVTAIAVGAASATVSKSVLFKSARFMLDRVWVLGRLARCFYCISHWLGAASSIWLMFRLGKEFDVILFMIFMFFIVAVASWVAASLIKNVPFEK